jgi:hypothetical protein
MRASGHLNVVRRVFQLQPKQLEGHIRKIVGCKDAIFYKHDHIICKKIDKRFRMTG